MARLKYPIDLNETTTDYVTFDHFPYTTNRPISGQRSTVAPGAPGSGPVDGILGTGGPAGPTPPSGGGGRNSISLYIPNSIPKMGYGNQWQAETMPGAKGEIFRNISTTLGLGLTNNPAESAKGVVDALGNAITNFPDAARQGLIEGVASLAGRQPNALLALGTGQIFNPNVEVVYQGPTLRSFSFAFTFAPKNSLEAQFIKGIIYEFKKWSAPTVEGAGGGMLKIPDVWLVRYSGLFAKNVNPFKKATLNQVDVGYNAGLNSHMTFADGEPVIITLRLDFTEVDYILQEDHDKAFNAGYLGGF
jgi:hypothetical protein